MSSTSRALRPLVVMMLLSLVGGMSACGGNGHPDAGTTDATTAQSDGGGDRRDAGPTSEGLRLRSGGISTVGDRNETSATYGLYGDGIEAGHRICSEAVCVTGGIAP
jgi:hypothetical protein